jgi:hypothetical protein
VDQKRDLKGKMLGSLGNSRPLPHRHEISAILNVV